MAVLLEEKIVTLEFSDLANRRPLRRPRHAAPRTPGVHQSGILAAVARKIGVLAADEKDEEEYPLLWALGNAWEEYCVSLHPDIEWQPGERTVDGISMTADGLAYVPFGRVPTLTHIIEEFKFTFKSCAADIDFLKDKKYWMWQHQGRGYCLGYGARHVCWHVCHIRGDYKAFGPVYKQYLVEFTDKEVEQTFAMLLNNKHLAVPEG